jgi:hypothetical protein
MAKKQESKPLVTDHSKEPHEIYSLKIDYIDYYEEAGEGPGEIIRKPGGERSVRSSYHNQGSILDFLLYFQKDYAGCTILRMSLIKVVYTDDIHHSAEITVGEIPFPHVEGQPAYDWIKPETWPKVDPAEVRKVKNMHRRLS